MPFGPGSDPLGRLGRTVCPQRLAERTWERDRPSAGPRLRLHEDEAITGLALECLTHGERTGVEVDRIPSEAERLTLT
jgi:hypothetical protein